MAPPSVGDSPEFGRLAVILAWISGFVDAVGYMLLGHIFPANMTGNTVLLGIDLPQGDWSEAARHAATWTAYLLGALAGGIAVKGTGFTAAAFPVTLLAALSLFDAGASHADDRAARE